MDNENRILKDKVVYLYHIFRQPDNIEVSLNDRLILANDILSQTYLMYSKHKSKLNMMKTVEFIQKRIRNIGRSDGNGNVCLRHLSDLERIWVRELLENILETLSVKPNLGY